MKNTNILLIISLLFIFNRATAQTDLQNTGIVFITTGSDLYINGNVTNAVTGALTNNGNLYITQNLTNSQASVAIGTGTLRLTGSAQQILAGTQPFRTFNLNTDNVSGFLLNNNLSVSGVHTFTNGVIASSATPNFLIYESGSSYSGAADAHHVSGWVKKIGNTSFVFPVGTGVVIRPVELVSLASSSEFNVHHFLSTPNTGSLLFPLVQLDPYEYWEINRISGGNAAVAMNWDRSRVDFPQYQLASIRSAYFTGGQWTDVGGSATGSVATIGNITSNTMSAFGQFTMGSISAVLPVSFLGLTATRNMNDILVGWKAGNEVSVDHYEVQRSEDGRNFFTAGTVQATAGAGIIEYTYADNQLHSGRLWYRIKSVDQDGKYMLSNIVMVPGTSSGTERFTIINPARGNLSVIPHGMKAGTYSYQLRNDGSQTVQTGRIEISGNGRHLIELNHSVKPGIYIFTISQGTFIQNQKISILR